LVLASSVLAPLLVGRASGTELSSDLASITAGLFHFVHTLQFGRGIAANPRGGRRQDGRRIARCMLYRCMLY